MKPIRCDLWLEFERKQIAKAVGDAVKPDDYGFVETTVRGRSLHAAIEAPSIPTLVRTLDDWLACVSIAVRVWGVKNDEG